MRAVLETYCTFSTAAVFLNMMVDSANVKLFIVYSVPKDRFLVTCLLSNASKPLWQK